MKFKHGGLLHSNMRERPAALWADDTKALARVYRSEGWGAQDIACELKKFGVRMSSETVKGWIYGDRHRRGPRQMGLFA